MFREKKNPKVVCDICGKLIDPRERRRDGLPAGLGFQLKNGLIINICTDCHMSGADPKESKRYKEREEQNKNPAASETAGGS